MIGLPRDIKIFLRNHGWVAVFLIALSIGWRMSNILYEEQKKVLTERLSAKDDQLQDYRERLHLIKEAEEKYFALTNAELKKKIQNICFRIRNLVSKHSVYISELSYKDLIHWEESDNLLRQELDEQSSPQSPNTETNHPFSFKFDPPLQMPAVTTPKGKMILVWGKMDIKDTVKALNQFYGTKLHPESILIKDELLSRIPPTFHKTFKYKMDIEDPGENLIGVALFFEEMLTYLE